jgi:hypothetical protein
LRGRTIAVVSGMPSRCEIQMPSESQSSSDGAR